MSLKALGSLLFNIFVCDLFSVLSNIDFPSYADNNTPYFSKVNLKKAIQSSEHATSE